jgi:hypothetical protein
MMADFLSNESYAQSRLSQNDGRYMQQCRLDGNMSLAVKLDAVCTEYPQNMHRFIYSHVQFERSQAGGDSRTWVR